MVMRTRDVGCQGNNMSTNHNFSRVQTLSDQPHLFSSTDVPTPMRRSATRCPTPRAPHPAPDAPTPWHASTRPCRVPTRPATTHVPIARAPRPMSDAPTPMPPCPVPCARRANARPRPPSPVRQCGPSSTHARMPSSPMPNTPH